MTFFNKKEEVIDLQLTQYGKYLLSQGELKPIYYAFFDDDILYDGNYGGITEEQNVIRKRIEEAPRPKTQYVFEGIEATITQNNKIIRNELPPDLRGNRYGTWEEKIQPSQTRNYATALSLGTSDSLTEKIPVWSISYLKGYLSSSQDYIGWPISSEGKKHLYDAGLPNIKIPQLESKIQYETKVVVHQRTAPLEEPGGPLADITDSFFEDSHDYLEEETFPDGTRFSLKEDYIILECKEENAPFLKDNFDIEVFEITSSTATLGQKKEVLLPLYFVKPQLSNIVDNILVDMPPLPINEQAMLEQLPVTDSSYVEHYFHIYVDREIDTEIICDLIDVKKDINTQLLDVFECPKKRTVRVQTPIDVYETPGGLTEEDIEEC